MLVTNFHVIDGANKIVVKLESGAMHEVSGVLADDSKSDVVVLRVRASGVPFLKLGESAKAQVGQHVTVIGSPLGLEGTVSDGIISAKRELPDKGKWLQITAPIAPGSSGSPVIDAKGEVLGVATMLMRGEQALNFAVPIEVAKALLAQVNPNTAVKPFVKLARPEENAVYGDAEYGEVLAAIDAENYGQALNLVKSLERRFPKNVEEFHEFRGIIFYKLKLYEAAIVACQQALKLKPGDANLWFILADSYNEHGGVGEAIAAYQQGLAIKPDNADGWNSLGTAYIKQHKADQGLAAYQQAVKIKPDHVFAWYNIGRTYLEQKKFRESIAPLQRAVEVDPNFGEAWLFLGLSYRQAKEHGYAAQSLYQYVALKSADPSGWFFLGLSERDLKHYGPAAQAFEHHTKLAPGDVDGWQELGRCYWRLNRADDAAGTLRRAISMKPNAADLWELLAVVYRDSGQTEKAIQAFQTYQALSSR